jgi:hypothetical protein
VPVISIPLALWCPTASAVHSADLPTFDGRRTTRLNATARAAVVATARGLIVETRHFPPPWSAEETEACFIVRDANGQALAYVYFEEEPGRRAAASALPPPRRFRAC